MLSFPNWTWRRVHSCALHSNPVRLWRLSPLRLLLSVLQPSLFQFFLINHVFQSSDLFPLSLFWTLSSRPFSVLYVTFFSSAFYATRSCSLQMIAGTCFLYCETARKQHNVRQTQQLNLIWIILSFFLDETQNNEVDEPLVWSSFPIGSYSCTKLASEKCLEIPV